MNPPALLLGLVVSTTAAAAVHLLRGATLRDLLSFWLLVQGGFWLGQVAALIFSDPFWAIGELHIVIALTGGLCAVLVFV
ncbi:MAG: hypothetical protein HYR71_11435, partial [Chloroflexi bacterium]|nr:hypothetical protein [Chloroflexota bacterium]